MPISIKLANGDLLTVAGLPPARTNRWVIRLKAHVIAGVEGGLISMDEACGRYSLSTQEFSAWQRAVNRFGAAGLRTTKLYEYRPRRARLAVLPVPTAEEERGSGFGGIQI